MHPHQSFTLSRSFFDLFLLVFLFSQARRAPQPFSFSPSLLLLLLSLRLCDTWMPPESWMIDMVVNRGAPGHLQDASVSFAPGKVMDVMFVSRHVILLALHSFVTPASRVRSRSVHSIYVQYESKCPAMSDVTTVSSVFVLITWNVIVLESIQMLWWMARLCCLYIVIVSNEWSEIR